MSILAAKTNKSAASPIKMKASVPVEEVTPRFVPAMTREERSRRFGIDCPDEVTFREWGIGGEYIKKLIIKNTHDKLQVVHYRQPRQKATFFIDFPEPVTLSSGMSFELVIRFRPTVVQQISDSIEIVVEGRGEFQVGLAALTPYNRLNVPEKFDFEFCAVRAITEATVDVKNTGTLPLSLSWELQKPFSLSPAAFDLPVGASQTLTLTFAPTEASALVARAVCRMANGSVVASFPVSGIGKYVFLRLVDPPVLDFGMVLNGTTMTKTITVQNLSSVKAQFNLTRLDKDIVNPFSITPTSGWIPRDGQQTFTVRFVPESTAANYSNTYQITGVGGNTLSVRCVATVEGPKASLSVKSLDYGDVDLDALAEAMTLVADAKASGSTAPLPSAVATLLRNNERNIVLKNLSSIETSYNFVGCEPGQAFRITPSSGTLGPGKLQNIKVVFQPTSPINYLRRVYVVCGAGDDAIALDLLGTGFNAKMRPAPFSLKHVRCYNRRVAGGIGRMTPDDVAAMLAAMEQGKNPEGEDESAAREALQASMEVLTADPNEGSLVKGSRSAAAASKAMKASADGSTSSVKKGAMMARRADLAYVLPADERFQLPFSLEDSRVVFRAGSQGETRTVTVRNNTSAKATATWSLPTSSGVNGTGPAMWAISPVTGDVPPFGTATFDIRLIGSARPGTTFGDYFECYVFYKQMRSFRLVSEATFVPSQCLLLQVQHVAMMTEASAPPAVMLPSHVAFPSCHKEDAVYQVTALKNSGETVISYSIQIQSKRLKNKKDAHPMMVGGSILGMEGSVDPEDDENPEEDEMNRPSDGSRAVFSVFPATGTILPGATALALFRFSPRTDSKYSGSAIVSFNESSLGARQIFLRGEGFVPQLTMAGNGVLSFRPTAIGGKTTRGYDLENPTRIPVYYNITVPPKYAEIVSVSPSSGVLQPCEKIVLETNFTPKSVRRYEVKIPVTVSSVRLNDTGSNRSEGQVLNQSLYAVGDGLIGIVSMEPLELRYDTVLVGTDASKQLTLFNSSLCDVAFSLRTHLLKGDASQAPSLEFAPGPTGILRARSHSTLDLMVTLRHRGSFSYLVYVVTDASVESTSHIQPSIDDIQRLPHCVVMLMGGHPSLEVTDVRSVYQRKSHLWRQMSIADVNDQLALPVTDQDTETSSFTFAGASANIKPIVCDLGVDVYRTAPTKVLLRLDNTGHCPVSFRFWFPHEGDVQKEPWHQDPVAGPEDLEMADVIDRRLFDVSPKQTVIAPNDHAVLVITYQHTRVGRHTLPVLLRIDKGKRLLLHLTARTLKESERYLSFHHSLAHSLMAVPIGDMDPPLQYTELQNLSHQVAEYFIDETALKDMRDKNFDFPIFQCLNPRGVIPAMSTLLLSWYFRPLEAKKYEVVIPIHLEGGGGSSGGSDAGGSDASGSEVYRITISGEGYHPLKATNAEVQAMHIGSMAPMPLAPTLIHPLLPMRLSLDVMRFGVVPVHSLLRQVLFLYNGHATDAFLFEWQSVLQYGDQLLEVDPPRGRIMPGEKIALRVTLYTGSTSHVIDHPIHCHVINDDLRQQRLAKRREREEEEAMQLESGPPATGHAAMQDGSQTSYSLTSGSQAMKEAARESRRGGTSVGAVSKVRQPVTTVPPKYQNTTRLKNAIQQMEEAAAAEEVDEKDPSMIDVDVLPTVLEVLIQTRIVQLDAYKEVYGREAAAASLYFPTFASYSADLEEKVEPDADELDIAKEVVEDVLLQLVRGRHVKDAYCDISDDPVPYFCQMRTEREDGVTFYADTPEKQSAPSAAGSSRTHDSGKPDTGRDSARVSDAALESASTEFTELLDPVEGELQCIAEEVLEDLLFGIITEGSGPTGVLTRAVNALSRSKSTSQAGSRAAAKAARTMNSRTGAAGGPAPFTPSKPAGGSPARRTATGAAGVTFAK